MSQSRSFPASPDCASTLIVSTTVPTQTQRKRAARSMLVLSLLSALAACTGTESEVASGASAPTRLSETAAGNQSGGDSNNTNPSTGTVPLPGDASAEPGPAGSAIRILSNRSDLISGGDALVEIVVAQASDLDGIQVSVGSTDVTRAFAMRENGRFMGVLENLAVGPNTVRVRFANGGVSDARVINHPNGGPVFSGPQVQPWTCNNPKRVDAQCNQAPEYSFRYMPAQALRNIATNSSPQEQRLAASLQPYDPAKPPADADIAMTTTDEGKTVPFIVRIERGFQNRDRYQIMSLFNPKADWKPWKPQTQWNRKVLVHHGGNVGVTFGPGNPPNGDISGTAPDGAEVALGDSITVALGRGFVTVSTALANLGHNVNLVTAAESLVMVKERIVEQYGEIRYTIGTGCSGGSIAQQHIANAYPGIYQGLIVQCSYPDVWTTAVQFADYHLLNIHFGNNNYGNGAPNYNRAYVPAVQWAPIYGHLPINPVVSDLAFFPKAFPTQANCPGLAGAATQYDKNSNPGGLRCGLVDYMLTQFGTRDPAVWSANERKLNRGFGGLPLDNTGVQYGLGALKQGLLTPDQFLTLNRDIGGLNVDIEKQPARTVADPLALSNAYRTGAINTAENMANVPIIDLRGPDPGIAHDAYHSWQMRARLKATQGHTDNHVIWFGQVVLAGDSTYSTEALLVMDQWLAAIESDKSSKALPEKVRTRKPADARDRCLSAQSAYSSKGPFVPGTGNLFYPAPIVPGADSSRLPKPPAEAAQILDTVANQVCGFDFSAFDSSGQSAAITGPLSAQQQLILQTRFGTPRMVAGDDIRTLTNKCVLKPVEERDYAEIATITDKAAFVRSVKAIFPQGVCDYAKPAVGTTRTLTWLQYGSASERITGGEPMPAVPANSGLGLSAAAFR